MSLGILEPSRDDYEATEAQLGGIEWFYGFAPSELTQSQASALLSIRDYAKAVVGSLCLQLWAKEEKTVSIFVAVFISQNEVIAKSVARGMRQRWRNRSDPDNLTTTIKRTAYYWDVVAFIDQVLKDVDDWGASLAMFSCNERPRS